jgi:hypothetical protein
MVSAKGTLYQWNGRKELEARMLVPAIAGEKEINDTASSFFAL